MATKTNVFHQLSSLAIRVLFDKGYLLNDLDWDVKAQKYTLRIRGADRKPMVAVGLITFSLKNNTIIVIDAVTHEKSEFKLIEMNGQSNTDSFIRFICDWAQKLRETAAYK